MSSLQTSSLQAQRNKLIARWLVLGVVMIIVQILLGGITRLTGSGLSITEWKPIMGSLPPLNEAAWQEAFSSYQNIAQYKYLNNHFTLSDFKFIFFWEWFHRLWARLIGIVFFIPFIYFIWKKYFTKDMIIPLIILFILGLMQGLIGWIMVASGLNDTNLYVNHIKLAIHFMAALLVLCYTQWFAMRLRIAETHIIIAPRLAQLIHWIIILLIVQLIYGAFMAGIKGATFAPSWPSINGAIIPDKLVQQNWLSHPINIHFVHRGLAYLLAVIILVSGWKLYNYAQKHQLNYLKKWAWIPAILVGVQVILGICTVLVSPGIILGKFGTFEILAELHQLTAMFLLMALTLQAYVVRSK